MNKCLIVYYSQSGTTANIASAIAEGISNNDYLVDLVNIYHEKPPDVLSYDLIGIGSPVYFFHPVSDVRKYLESLPDLCYRSFFVFMAYGTNPGKSIEIIKKTLLKKNGIFKGAITCRNANFVMGIAKAGLSLDQVRDEDIVVAREFGMSLVVGNQ